MTRREHSAESPSTWNTDCPASVLQTNGTVHATSFVGSDEYPARTECIYELSYDATCGGKAALGLQ